MVGGTAPQVFAHSAMTRNFEITDEIEVNDDLDNKPDECDKLAAKAKEKQRRFPVEGNAFFGYSSALADVASTVKRLSLAQLYFRSSAYGDAGLPQFVSVSLEGKPILFPGEAKRKLETEILVLSHLFPSTNRNTRERFEFELAFDSSEIATTARVLRHDDQEAHRAFIAYDSMLDLWRCSARTPKEILVSKNTEISWVKNQVLVVTRLPRADLDLLLATNAK